MSNRYQGPNEKVTPQWKDVNVDHTYIPSYNQAPSRSLPVLATISTLDNKTENSERSVCPMLWGLVPFWHKGNPMDTTYKTFNCRADGIREKSSYRVAFSKGRRCVVLSDGFFEWKKVNGQKEPYFIYFPQPKKVSMSERKWTSEEEEMWDVDGEWRGPRLLTIAGIYDIWKSPKDGHLLYSFTIITVGASNEMKWLHDRMPAVLDGEETVNMWLDSENVSPEEALTLLKPAENLEWHRVSTVVNSSKNNTLECVLPLRESKATPKNTLTKWLSMSKRKTVKKEGEEQSPSKKIKTE
ncbi:embryonic stem cell-specific 5-hydroxymethylcytosine-binding protein-like [Limulus polyphemus]|uniref:Abasic site processing protein HMCES n=1 Tax=Limulus polyphemus TaxID=6850 RepID=A0ABM1BX87_LIMPO|nr:embryonic stem cell-specific 5-hydroxymethylcytosine-binding protein-like [Limulus polyphemus]